MCQLLSTKKLPKPLVMGAWSPAPPFIRDMTIWFNVNLNGVHGLHRRMTESMTGKYVLNVDVNIGKSWQIKTTASKTKRLTMSFPTQAVTWLERAWVLKTRYMV